MIVRGASSAHQNQLPWTFPTNFIVTLKRTKVMKLKMKILDFNLEVYDLFPKNWIINQYIEETLKRFVMKILKRNPSCFIFQVLHTPSKLKFITT